MAYTTNFMPSTNQGYDYGVGVYDQQQREEEERRRREQQANAIQITQPVSPDAVQVAAAPTATATDAGNLQMVGGRLKVSPNAVPTAPVEQPQAVAPESQAMVPPATNAESLRAAQNAAAGQMPPAPVNPQQPQPQPQQAFMPEMAEFEKIEQQTQDPAQTQAMDRFLAAQNDPLQLMQLAKDPSQPETLRRLSSEQAYRQLTNQREQEKAQEKIKSDTAKGDFLSVADSIRGGRKGNEEGSWARYIMLKALDNEAAKVEGSKLGLFDTWTRSTVTDPVTQQQKIVQVLQSGTGKLLRGTDLQGNELSPEELNTAAVGNNYGKLKPDVSMQDVEKNGMAGRVATLYNAQGQPRTVVLVGNKEMPYDASWKPRVISTAAAKVDYQLTSDLFKKHSGNVIDMLKDYETLRGPLSPESRNEFFQKYGYGSTLPAANTAPTNAITGTGPVIPSANVVTTPNVANTVTGPAKPITNTGPAVVGGRISGGVGTGGGVGTPIGNLKANQEIGVAGAKENIQVQGARAQSFNKILDEEVRPQAQAGDVVSSVRKQQFAIFDRPGVDATKLFGLYNAAGENPGDQKLSILRDIFGGVFKPEAEVSTRLAALNLTPQERSALMEYNTANQKINVATLKANSGPGAVSDAEQKANRDANVDITKVPALGAYNAMAQSQFDGDRARWKADWATKQPAQNALELDKAWRKENQRLADMYRSIATERAKFISANGGTTQAVQLGYKRFAVPEYDPATESWKKTKPLGQIIGGQ